MKKNPIPYDSHLFSELVTDLLREATSVRFVANGKSMRPFIHDGDTVTVRPSSAHTLRRGDVALCRDRDGHILVHRFVKIRPDEGKVFLQGDAAMAHKESVPLENVLGVVTHVERKGRIMDLSGSWQGMLGRLWGRYRIQRIVARFLSTGQD